MFEYHGWVHLCSTAEAVDDEPELPMAEIQRLVDGWTGRGLMSLGGSNGASFVHFAGMPNHVDQDVFDFFAELGRLAPGSYGLLHWHYHGTHNEFRVQRMVRGQVTEHPEPLLSPVIPGLEDEWVFSESS
ncbi:MULTISPECIES: Imm7 family immunity protein [unclassified Crossiella]|uniref:Imm7 family immunity protein n=1 Tax=unclassified Crossiella TaxID=2620835 RepID=UPI001FFE5ECA|nr:MULTISPECIES: Imm7 family immunity protein [unclassified Crossiella]MCK2237884.1 immunity 7 family protein [Crossiella sp. S99.2]MCK2255170.1 immunity 7 family protein [Crossiella sp. S99.1]